MSKFAIKASVKSFFGTDEAVVTVELKEDKSAVITIDNVPVTISAEEVERLKKELDEM